MLNIIPDVMQRMPILPGMKDVLSLKLCKVTVECLSCVHVYKRESAHINRGERV